MAVQDRSGNFLLGNATKEGRQGRTLERVCAIDRRLQHESNEEGRSGFFYHTGDEKRIVGIVEVIGEYQPDPTDETGKFGLVVVKAVKDMLQARHTGRGQSHAETGRDEPGEKLPPVGAAGARGGMETDLHNGWSEIVRPLYPELIHAREGIGIVVFEILPLRARSAAARSAG